MAHSMGDLVIYGTNGVCEIEDLRDENFAGQVRRYYILRPQAEAGHTRIYVPADNETLVAGMEPLLSAADLRVAVQEAKPFPPQEWPADGRGRNKRCKELLTSGRRDSLIRLIKTLKSEDRTLTAADEAACLRAAAMLYQEFSRAFFMDVTDMIPFLMGQITVPDKKSE